MSMKHDRETGRAVVATVASSSLEIWISEYEDDPLEEPSSVLSRN